MTGLDREYTTLDQIALLDEEGRVTAAGLRVMIREEVDFAIDLPEARHELIAALADPGHRWHDEIVLRLVA